MRAHVICICMYVHTKVISDSGVIIRMSMYTFRMLGLVLYATTFIVYPYILTTYLNIPGSSNIRLEYTHA